ncbi:MAG: glycoside hydrolase family 3 C-terminal domain-containing protein, partial [Clostridia bacterium]
MTKNVSEIVAKLTLEEKCALCSGVTNWRTTPIIKKKVPSVFVSDGPHGLRKEKGGTFDVANVMQESVPATCFPPAVTLASSWDTTLVGKVGQAIANEAKEQDVDVVLGPGINIKRNPLCGRNFEYFSEDPFLAGQLAVGYINGVQSENIGTSLKHFAVNSQEYRRMTISSEVDVRALREIYLSAFETAVKNSQPYTIMCSYNLINGLHASDNKGLLWDILREEWGFDGIVVSDWGAVNDRVMGIVAGLDIEMPTSNGIGDKVIFDAVKEGRLSTEDLDKTVTRILKFVYKCVENRTGHENYKADMQANYDLACEAATKGAVLLKNDNNALPLKKDSKIAIIGTLAKEIRYQGSGSSRINPYKLTSFIDYLEEIKQDYQYTDGYDIKDGNKIDKKAISAACEIAKGKDAVLLFVGLTDEYESEGFDREDLEMPLAHNKLIEEIRKVNDNVIVVLAGGSPVTMPWYENVNAILNMYLCGCAGGKACYQLLYGEVNPSGKIAESYPLSMRDNPAYLYYKMGPQTVEYRESIYVGYRYFDKAKKDVLFPFGYGLSYTKFEYNNLKLNKTELTEKDTLSVSFCITNTGNVDGEEIAQIYVRDKASSIFREDKALKAFVKIDLKAGERKEVSVTLDKRSFAFYNTKLNDWTVEKGEFDILVGASSRDIRLSKIITINAPDIITPNYLLQAPSYFDMEHTAEYCGNEFEALLGRKLVDNHPLKKGEIDYNSVIGDLGVCLLGKIIVGISG